MVSNISTANGIATAVERGSSRIAHAGDAIAGAIEKLAVKVESAAETIRPAHYRRWLYTAITRAADRLTLVLSDCAQ